MIRVFTARPKPGKADELEGLFQEVSIPFVDGHPGLIAQFSGRGMGDAKDDLVMISVWNDLDAMKGMTGDDWEKEVIPDEREAAITERTWVHHFVSFD